LKRLPGSSRPFTPTYGVNATFPVACHLKFSANTVAGQWRILTALPITRWREVIDDERATVKSEIN
jgi:hypothetical protein